MVTGNRLRARFKMGIVFTGFIFLIATITEGAEDRAITMKVVGPDNQALAGARIYKYFEIQNGRRVGKEYVCDENGLVGLAEGKVFEYEWERNGVMLYGLYENVLAGFAKVKADDLGKELEMKLTPACRVYGKLKSTELANLNQKLLWAIVYVFLDDDRPLAYMGERGNFRLLLPVGKYKLQAYGTRTYSKYEDIEIVDGQKELEINLDLPADRLAYLIGKQAPELQQIKGWINSEPIKLSGLRGKVVLLDFWGTWCGPCVAAIPELIKLHEKYHDKGLVIISVHTDSMKSIDELEKAISNLSKTQWDGKTMPFAVALDGGGRYKVEGARPTSQGATTAAYGIQSFPTMVLIDKKGKVVDNFYPDVGKKLLEELLAADIDNKP